MGAITCCQNQVYRHQEFRQYCQTVASADSLNYFAAIQQQESQSGKELVTQKIVFKAGSWNKGQTQTGKGVIFAPEQFYYEGQIFEGVAKGQGKMVWPNKFFYMGSVDQNKASGNGSLHLGQKKIQLKGNWVRGYPQLNHKMGLNKQGKQGGITFVDPNGTKTEEEFFKGPLNVKLEFHNGIVYEGEVKQKNTFYRIEGKGIMKYPDGSFYTGDFVEGKMDGHGKYYWGTTGNWFEGNYKSNVREGQGTYYYSQKEFETGDWKGGVLMKNQAAQHHEAKPPAQNQGVPVL